jgi:hypothetical protein
MHRRALISLPLTAWILARPGPIRFLRWQNMQLVVAGLIAAGEKFPEFPSAAEWDAWIRGRDLEIRGRAERSVEDSISAWILAGSYTSHPRIATEKEAVTATGDLTPAARARIDAFIQALDERDDERFKSILEFLKHRRITEEELRPFLGGIVRRLALDKARDQRMRENTTADVLAVNLAAEETLRKLKNDHAAPARIRRIAVIGAGLDFAGTREHYDFHPPQVLTPFAVLEAALRQGLAQAGEAQVTVFELSSFALAHLKGIGAKAQSSSRYVLQLPRKRSGGWNGAMVSYWNHFGESIGTTAAAAVPAELPDVDMRAVAVKPQIAARVSVEEMDVVAQTAEVPGGQGFDLVVAVNFFSDYNRVEQTLALASIAQMTNAGGIFLANGMAAAYIPQELESLGTHWVSYTDGGSRSEIAIYRRR